MIKIATAVALLGVVSASSPVVQSVDMQPLDQIGSALHLPERRTICLELSKELDPQWPVLDAAYEWNRNGSNLFTTDIYVRDCDGIVLITQSDTKQWWGSTEFYSRDLINVQLSSTAPANRYSAVVCHELGHVLGLPHSFGDGSCMDHSQNNPKPTEKDLSTVGAEPWSASIARNKILGVK